MSDKQIYNHTYGGVASFIGSISECGDANCKCEPITETDSRGFTAHQKFAADVWELMDELGNLLISKQLDYGPGNINNAFGGPINGLLVRMGDKFERLKNLFRDGETKAQFEPIEDSFKDLANYAVIGLMVKRNKWPASKENK